MQFHVARLLDEVLDVELHMAGFSGWKAGEGSLPAAVPHISQTALSISLLYVHVKQVHLLLSGAGMPPVDLFLALD